MIVFILFLINVSHIIVSIASADTVIAPDNITTKQRTVVATPTPTLKNTPNNTSSNTPKHSPQHIVQNFQIELLNVMKKGKALGFQGRYKQLNVAILKSHDLTKIIKIVAGRQWRTLSDTQKITLTDAFMRFSISAYASNFKDFSGESFAYIATTQTTRGDIIIHTMLTIPDDDNVKLDYILRKNSDGWRIINIIANGVSDLALRRSEYTSILKRKNFNALIVKINKKIDNYAN